MADGIQGLVDFVGYPVAQPANVPAPAPPVGFYGLLDFTGIPVGMPAPTRVGGGVSVGGRRHEQQRALVRSLIMQEQSRSVLDGMRREAWQRLSERVIRQEIEFQAEIHHQRKEMARFTNVLLLAEV